MLNILTVLEPGQTISMVFIVTIPRYISGLFFIGVKTDIYNDIIEYENENSIT